MGHIGDGDQQMPAAGVVRGRIGFGKHRVVEIPGVGAVDGDERDGPQILAVAKLNRFGRVGLGQRFVGEFGGQAVLMNGDETQGALVVQRAQPFDHLRLPRLAMARTLGLDLAEQQFSGLCAVGIGLAEAVVLLGALVHRPQSAAGAGDFIDSQHPFAAAAEFANDRAAVCAVLQRLHAGQHPVSRGQHGPTSSGLFHVDLRRGGVAVPRGWPGQQFAVLIGADNLQHRHRGQLPWYGHFAPATAIQVAVVFELLQQSLQLFAVVALDVEGLGEFPLAHRRSAFADEIQDLGLGWERGL